MPVPPPKNPGCPIFGVGMPHARFGGDALTIMFVSMSGVNQLSLRITG